MLCLVFDKLKKQKVNPFAFCFNMFNYLKFLIILKNEGGDPSPPSSRLTLLRLISDHTLYCGRSPPYYG